MIRKTSIVGIAMLLCIAPLCSQVLHWTGTAGNNDFFDEANWEEESTGLPPADGNLDADTDINRDLSVMDAQAEIMAAGGIQLGSGSIIMERASLSASSLNGGTVTMNTEAYLKLEDASPLLGTSSINFMSALAWLKLVNLKPADALNSHLEDFKVQGAAAHYLQTIRIDNYYTNGCIVRPNDAAVTPLTVFNAPSLEGEGIPLMVDVIHSGSNMPGNMNNATASFVLKRGYMAVMANNSDGTGISKAFIASENDLEVNSMPSNLKGKVSFVRVVPWNWVAKKGIGGNVTGLNETWHYNWSNAGVSTIERENTPMAWGKGGADDDGDILLYKSKYKTNHVLAFNESDNCNDQSGQYGDLCNTDVAVVTYENLMKTGLRLVSPSGRENAPFGWLKEFYDKATAQNIRIDVIGVHWYDWGSNPQNSPNADPQQVFNRFKTYLNQVHDLYNLPIWITEFNANPNRTTAVNKAFMKLALPYLESLDYVERYAWFEPFSDVADYYDGSGDYTEVGLVYKNQPSTPSVKEEVLSAANNLDGLVNSGELFVFEDYFENYSDGQSLGSVYTVWEGSLSAVDAAQTSTWGSAYEGNGFARSDASNTSLYVRKSFELEVGKTYVWELATKMTDGAKHVMSVIPADIYPKLDCYNADWEKHSIEFTVQEGHADVTLSLYRWPTKNIYIDNFVLREKGPATAIDSPEVLPAISIYPNPVKSILNLKGHYSAAELEIYDMNGRLIMRRPYAESLHVPGLAKGVYLLKVGEVATRFIKK